MHQGKKDANWNIVLFYQFLSEIGYLGHVFTAALVHEWAAALQKLLLITATFPMCVANISGGVICELSCNMVFAQGVVG